MNWANVVSYSQSQAHYNMAAKKRARACRQPGTKAHWSRLAPPVMWFQPNQGPEVYKGGTGTKTEADPGSYPNYFDPLLECCRSPWLNKPGTSRPTGRPTKQNCDRTASWWVPSPRRDYTRRLRLRPWLSAPLFLVDAVLVPLVPSLLKPALLPSPSFINHHVVHQKKM